MSSIYLTVHLGIKEFAPLAKKDCIALVWAPQNDQYTDGSVSSIDDKEGSRECEGGEKEERRKSKAEREKSLVG